MTEYRFGPFELIESEVVRLWRNDPGPKRIEVSLEPKQEQILLYLIKHHTKVVSRKELYNAVWYNYPNGRRETEENNLSAQISFLRDGQALLHETVHGDTDRACGQIDDWAYRIDRQRPFVQQYFQHAEIREPEPGLFNTSGCVPRQGAHRLHHRS